MKKPEVYSIQDILDIAEKYKMPLEKMRFFVGKNCRQPKCFGIYKDKDGSFVVYKNKADGSRAVRYRGKSEAEASRILFDKLSEEIQTRKKMKAWWEHQEQLANDPDYAYEYEKEIARRKDLRTSPGYNYKNSSRKSDDGPDLKKIAAAGVLVAGAAVCIPWWKIGKPHAGYYENPVTHQQYYYNNQNWYSFADDVWDLAYDVSDWSDYSYYGGYYDDSYGTAEFDGEDYSVWDSVFEWASSSSDQDSDDSGWWSWSSDYDDNDDWDYDFDWGDWDSSDTDWDSDW